jgi:hypothetical protein
MELQFAWACRRGSDAIASFMQTPDPHERIQMHRSKNGFRLADRPADDKRLGIVPVEVRLVV